MLLLYTYAHISIFYVFPNYFGWCMSKGGKKNNIFACTKYVWGQVVGYTANAFTGVWLAMHLGSRPNSFDSGNEPANRTWTYFIFPSYLQKSSCSTILTYFKQASGCIQIKNATSNWWRSTVMLALYFWYFIMQLVKWNGQKLEKKSLAVEWKPHAYS